MRFDEIARVLRPEPMPLELGFERLESGVLHVACRTDMHGCRGEMIDWWFRSLPGNERYRWWHPVDHVSARWEEVSPGAYVGSICYVEERLTALESVSLAIQFREPSEFFEQEELHSSILDKRISAVICTRVSPAPGPARDAEGRLLGGRLVHVARDTAWGTVLRSHFFLGQDLPAAGKSADQIAQLFPDNFAENFLQHCYNEYTYLSRILPPLFEAEANLPIGTPPW